MCSIIGYRGKNSAAPILVNGLQRMEYRGYDSVGIATKSKNQILLRKGVRSEERRVGKECRSRWSPYH